MGLRRVINRAIERGEWLLGASGVLTLAFGVMMTMSLLTSATMFPWTIGGYAIVSGLLLVALAVNIRHWPHRMVKA
jgi:uncharacterized membrane protein HdeD (DUF308 family)